MATIASFNGRNPKLSGATLDVEGNTLLLMLPTGQKAVLDIPKVVEIDGMGFMDWPDTQLRDRFYVSAGKTPPPPAPSIDPLSVLLATPVPASPASPLGSPIPAGGPPQQAATPSALDALMAASVLPTAPTTPPKKGFSLPSMGKGRKKKPKTAPAVAMTIETPSLTVAKPRLDMKKLALFGGIGLGVVVLLGLAGFLAMGFLGGFDKKDAVTLFTGITAAVDKGDTARFQELVDVKSFSAAVAKEAESGILSGVNELAAKEKRVLTAEQKARLSTDIAKSLEGYDKKVLKAVTGKDTATLMGIYGAEKFVTGVKKGQAKDTYEVTVSFSVPKEYLDFVEGQKEMLFVYTVRKADNGEYRIVGVSGMQPLFRGVMRSLLGSYLDTATEAPKKK